MKSNTKKFLNTEEFLNCIKRGIIPPLPPIGSSIGGNNYGLDISYFKAREECIDRGMWAIVDKVWTRQLAQWIGSRSCLEIMAGAGWLAKALNSFGIKIVATDSKEKTWDHGGKSVFTVRKLDGLKSVEKYQAEILIVSWPPYDDLSICRICEMWGSDRPIVYIGEGSGGCNAPDEFWRNFREIDDKPEIPLMAWNGLHDYVFIGNYVK